MKKIVLTYQKNIRDLGGMIGFNGKKVKSGRLYRGGFLGRVTEQDIVKINQLKLTDIIDFRSESEFVHRPDYQFEGVTYHNFSAMVEDVKSKNSKTEDSNLLWFLGDKTDGFKHMYRLYPEIVLSDVGIKAFSSFFNLLINKDKGVFYFHCSQGKDRAGLAAYLLEIALGVSHEDAVKDYLITNEAMKIRIKELIASEKDKPFYNKTYEKSLIEVFYAKIEYLNHAIDEVKKKYGDVMNYLINVLHVDIEKLRAMYLE